MPTPAISKEFVQAATAEDFKHWMKDHPDFVSTKIVKESSKWGRIVCTWDEKKTDGPSIKHIFTATVDLKTGDVYMDCSKKKLWTKNVALACARPIHTVAKTLYHLSMAGVARQIYKAATGKKTKTEALKKSIRQIADIVRTPAYGVAMTVVNIAAAAIIPFSADKAYDLRNLHGRIEQSLNWGKKHTGWTLALCFQSGFNIFKDDFGAEPAKHYTEEVFQSKKQHLEQRISQKDEKISKAPNEAEIKTLTAARDELKEQLAELIDTNERKVGETDC